MPAQVTPDAAKVNSFPFGRNKAGIRKEEIEKREGKQVGGPVFTLRATPGKQRSEGGRTDDRGQRSKVGNLWGRLSSLPIFQSSILGGNIAYDR